jgi:NitT/TauT family transport system ATP-binding protein
MTSSVSSATIATKSNNSVGLEIENLQIQFAQGRPVLEDLHLKVQPSEIWALVGASGCGKSTLLRAIAGLQGYQQGSIRFSSLVAPADERRNDLEQRTAFVFQDATLLPWRTVFENVKLPLELNTKLALKLSATDIQHRVESALNSVALKQEHWRLFPRQLSGGMQMRTSIARALITNPSLLLLDEPFAALDDILRNRLNQMLLELWSAQPRTILFVTHNIAEAVILSHKIAVVAHRRIAQTITNKLPWPRNTQQRTCLEFAQMYGQVSQALSDESLSEPDPPKLL